MLPLWLSAQNVSVRNADIELGQVEYKRPVSVTYILKNNTSNTVNIKSVETSCGCTKAEYEGNTIAPNSEMKMNVTYDALLLGQFFRTVTVVTDADEAPIELSMSGKVVTQVENFTGDYPYTIGGLLCDVNEITFDDVNKGSIQKQEIHIMNPLGQYVEPVLMHLPPYLRAEILPAKIAPRKSGVIYLTLKSSNINSYGLNQSSIFLAKNKGENVSDDKEIIVSAVLLPTPPTAQNTTYKRGPHINLSSKSVDMSNFAGKAKKKSVIEISNTGNGILEISAVQMFTPGLEIKLPTRRLIPGQKTKMTVTGIAEILKKQKAKPRVLMITNDADNPKIVIEVKQ